MWSFPFYLTTWTGPLNLDCFGIYPFSSEISPQSYQFEFLGPSESSFKYCTISSLFTGPLYRITRFLLCTHESCPCHRNLSTLPICVVYPTFGPSTWIDDSNTVFYRCLLVSSRTVCQFRVISNKRIVSSCYSMTCPYNRVKTVINNCTKVPCSNLTRRRWRHFYLRKPVYKRGQVR